MTCKADSPIQTLSQFASPGRFRLRLLFPGLFLLQRLLNDPDNRMSPRKILLFLQYPPRRSLQSISLPTKRRYDIPLLARDFDNRSVVRTTQTARPLAFHGSNFVTQRTRVQRRIFSVRGSPWGERECQRLACVLLTGRASWVWRQHFVCVVQSSRETAVMAILFTFSR